MAEEIEKLRHRIDPVGKGHYLLGLSGGADSVALMYMLLPDIKEGRIQLEAVHVNHGLRGNESDEDERYCSELCKQERIPLTVYHAYPAGKRDEASARSIRFGFLRKRYLETEADGVILAHHADDQAETFLIRLLRGAGPEGLSCMKQDEVSCGMRIIRPMLKLTRPEIRAALMEDGISWREDSSNQDTSYVRNRIRLELIPMLNALSRTAAEKICRAAALIGEDDKALKAEAVSIMKHLTRGDLIDADLLREQPTALRTRVLRMWWNENAPVLSEHTLNTAQTDALDHLLTVRRGKINLPGDRYAVRSGKYLFLRGGTAEIPEPVAVTEPETRFGSFRLQVTVSTGDGDPGDGKKTQEVPPDLLHGCVIRTRRPGDRIHPFGSSGSRKLQDYLTDRRIPEPFRDRIPLLCRDREVLLVCGVGAGNIPRLRQGDAAIRLVWHGEMPWNE